MLTWIAHVAGQRVPSPVAQWNGQFIPRGVIAAYFPVRDIIAYVTLDFPRIQVRCYMIGKLRESMSRIRRCFLALNLDCLSITSMLLPLLHIDPAWPQPELYTG